MSERCIDTFILNKTAFPLNIAFTVPWTQALPLHHTNGLESGETWGTKFPFLSQMLLRRMTVHVYYDHGNNRFRGSEKRAMFFVLLGKTLAGLLGCLWTTSIIIRHFRVIIKGGHLSSLRVFADIIASVLCGFLVSRLIVSARQGPKINKGRLLVVPLKSMPIDHQLSPDIRLAICWIDGHFVLWDLRNDQQIR